MRTLPSKAHRTILHLPCYHLLAPDGHTRHQHTRYGVSNSPLESEVRWQGESAGEARTTWATTVTKHCDRTTDTGLLLCATDEGPPKASDRLGELHLAHPRTEVHGDGARLQGGAPRGPWSMEAVSLCQGLHGTPAWLLQQRQVRTLTSAAPVRVPSLSSTLHRSLWMKSLAGGGSLICSRSASEVWPGLPCCCLAVSRWPGMGHPFRPRLLAQAH